MRKRLTIILIISAVLLGAVSIAVSATIDRKKKDELYRQVELFSDAMAIIQAEYVDAPSPKDLIYGALKGMLSSLDQHSQFMDQELYNDLKMDTVGRFGGTGLEIAIKDGLVTVITPIEDSPAWRAGIKAKDIIVKINDESTGDLSFTDVVKKIRGKPGTQLTLTVLRQSEGKIMEFKITRDVIKVKDIKETRILEDGVGYVRLVEFRENTVRDIVTAINNLSKQGMSVFILDLRNNPGGLLDSAVKVAEQFVEKGKMIVYTRGRRKEQDIDFISHATKTITAVPMAILINEGSASGSELLAACLQDYGRAIIIGTRSFGKNVVQSVIPLSDGSALKLTTCRFFPPSGRKINENGVTPDIIIEQTKALAADEKEHKIKKIDDIIAEIGKKEAQPEENKSDYKSDNQIMRAIDILKAMRLYKGPAK
ncbi:MAG: S41 family peptidase [Candidatus Omnitrophota bacterium]